MEKLFEELEKHISEVVKYRPEHTAERLEELLFCKQLLVDYEKEKQNELKRRNAQVC